MVETCVCIARREVRGEQRVHKKPKLKVTLQRHVQILKHSEYGVDRVMMESAQCHPGATGVRPDCIDIPQDNPLPDEVRTFNDEDVDEIDVEKISNCGSALEDKLHDVKAELVDEGEQVESGASPPRQKTPGTSSSETDYQAKLYQQYLHALVNENLRNINDSIIRNSPLAFALAAAACSPSLRGETNAGGCSTASPIHPALLSNYTGLRQSTSEASSSQAVTTTTNSQQRSAQFDQHISNTGRENLYEPLNLTSFDNGPVTGSTGSGPSSHDSLQPGMSQHMPSAPSNIPMPGSVPPHMAPTPMHAYNPNMANFRLPLFQTTPGAPTPGPAGLFPGGPMGLPFPIPPALLARFPALQFANFRETAAERKRREQAMHIKKPLNAFMLFMKEHRQKVIEECTLKESAAINQILGQKWHNLTRQEQEKYYEMAKEAREKHKRDYPDWKRTEQHQHSLLRRKRKRRLEPRDPKDREMKKCRARFGVNQVDRWCKPCKRKKKCARYYPGVNSEADGDADSDGDPSTPKSGHSRSSGHTSGASIVTPGSQLTQASSDGAFTERGGDEPPKSSRNLLANDLVTRSYAAHNHDSSATHTDHSFASLTDDDDGDDEEDEVGSDPDETLVGFRPHQGDHLQSMSNFFDTQPGAVEVKGDQLQQLSPDELV